MNNQERLESHKRMYSFLEEQAIKTKWEDEINDWQLLMNRFPEFLNLIEDLISNVENLVSREQELLVENQKLKDNLEWRKKAEAREWGDSDDEEDNYGDDENCWVEYRKE